MLACWNFIGSQSHEPNTARRSFPQAAMFVIFNKVHRFRNLQAIYTVIPLQSLPPYPRCPNRSKVL